LQVTVLCDLRRNAISRKPGFSRRALDTACTAAGVRYVHLPQLGIPSDLRQNASTRQEHDQLLDHYRRQILPAQVAALGQIQEWLVRGERVALMCFERDLRDCHRACVAAAVEAALGDGYRAAEIAPYQNAPA
jgi:uncharacterized protein (DUF488 family)